MENFNNSHENQNDLNDAELAAIRAGERQREILRQIEEKYREELESILPLAESLSARGMTQIIKHGPYENDIFCATVTINGDNHFDPESEADDDELHHAFTDNYYAPYAFEDAPIHRSLVSIRNYRYHVDEDGIYGADLRYEIDNSNTIHRIWDIDLACNLLDYDEFASSMYQSLKSGSNEYSELLCPQQIDNLTYVRPNQVEVDTLMELLENGSELALDDIRSGLDPLLDKQSSGTVDKSTIHDLDSAISRRVDHDTFPTQQMKFKLRDGRDVFVTLDSEVHKEQKTDQSPSGYIQGYGIVIRQPLASGDGYERVHLEFRSHQNFRADYDEDEEVIITYSKENENNWLGAFSRKPSHKEISEFRRILEELAIAS